MTELPVIALLGLGEAGSAIAADLVAAGVRTLGFDPDTSRSVAGVERVGAPGDAAAPADAVLSVNAASVALGAARSVAMDLTAAHLYADLNTTSAATKRDLAAAIAPSRAAFVDVAVLGPLPGRGLGVPCLASGPGAPLYAAIFGPLGTPVAVLGDVPGEAATRKLVRSVFTKGIAAAAIESLSAARAADCEPWLRTEIAAVLDAADEALLERLVAGSSVHARRRVDEMDAAVALLSDLGVEPHVAAAAAAVLAELAGGPNDVTSL